MTDERFYEIALAEVRSGRLREGLLAKFFAETDGDKAKAEARYIKYRADELALAHETAKAEAREFEWKHELEKSLRLKIYETTRKRLDAVEWATAGSELLAWGEENKWPMVATNGQTRIQEGRASWTAFVKSRPHVDVHQVLWEILNLEAVW